MPFKQRIGWWVGAKRVKVRGQSSTPWDMWGLQVN